MSGAVKAGRAGLANIRMAGLGTALCVAGAGMSVLSAGAAFAQAFSDPPMQGEMAPPPAPAPGQPVPLGQPMTLDQQGQQAPQGQPAPQPMPQAAPQPAPQHPGPPSQPAPTTQAAPPQETRLSNPVAVFSGLDKITGRIISFDAYIDETVQFGALRVTPRACYSRPSTEAPRTDAFLEVDEITLDNQVRRIFTGWMFAASPGLNAVDHPIYDVWLTDCRVSSEVPPPDGFDASRFTKEGLDLIPRPEGWVSEPLPKPTMGGAGTEVGGGNDQDQPSTDQPED